MELAAIYMCVAFDEDKCKDCYHGKPHYLYQSGTVKCTQWEKCNQPLSLTGKHVLARCVDIMDIDKEENDE